MKNIGKYQGVFCYTCTHKEWYEHYKAGYNLEDYIFIIDGVMVRNNKIIGYYDGSRVEDRYDEKPYYVEKNKAMNGSRKVTITADNSKWDEKFVEEVKAMQEGRMTTASYEELVNQVIDFSNYSTIVDEFFALLEE